MIFLKTQSLSSGMFTNLIILVSSHYSHLVELGKCNTEFVLFGLNLCVCVCMRIGSVERPMINLLRPTYKRKLRYLDLLFHHGLRGSLFNSTCIISLRLLTKGHVGRFSSKVLGATTFLSPPTGQRGSKMTLKRGGNW